MPLAREPNSTTLFETARKHDRKALLSENGSTALLRFYEGSSNGTYLKRELLEHLRGQSISRV
jgi:hypothetical protein